MLTVVIGLTSALVFGSADFLGGLAAKRMGAVLTTAIASVVGLVALLIASPLTGSVWSPQAVLLGAASGVTGAVAIGLLYACLAIGPMSILAPLTGVVSAIVPLTAGLMQGERLTLIGYLALGLALIAVVLVGFVPEKGAVRPSAKGVLMALGSGIAIGIFLIIIDKTPHDSGIIPIVANRATNATIMFTLTAVLALVARARRTTTTRAWRSGLPFAIACGVVDVIANVGLLIGVRIGELSVMAVLTALYPAGTIVLAGMVLKERIAPVQYVGLALAMIAAAMLALA
ncbi:MAG: DMT family transporter [Salinibacterium sp.]|nr:MAG: DMT family transporter [Salinibacterium sp.]